MDVFQVQPCNSQCNTFHVSFQTFCYNTWVAFQWNHQFLFRAYMQLATNLIFTFSFHVFTADSKNRQKCLKFCRFVSRLDVCPLRKNINLGRISSEYQHKNNCLILHTTHAILLVSQGGLAKEYTQTSGEQTFCFLTFNRFPLARRRSIFTKFN